MLCGFFGFILEELVCCDAYDEGGGYAGDLECAKLNTRPPIPSTKIAATTKRFLSSPRSML